MALLDITLMNKYISMLGLTGFSNISSDTILSTFATTISNLSISNNTILQNLVSINSNLYVSGITICNGNLSIMSNLYSISNNTIIYGNLNTNILNISGYSQLNNGINIYNNLNISGNSIISNNITTNNLNILQNTINNNSITFLSNLYVSNNSIFKNLYPINILSVSGNTILQGNTTINSSLYVSNNSLFNNNISIISNLYVSNNSLFNIIYANQLNISNTSIFNNAVTTNSLFISSNTIFNNNLYINNLYTSSNSILNNNLTVNSNLNISSISIFNNTTINSNLNISNNSIINNNVSANTFYISGNTNINNNLLVNNVTTNATLTISGITTLFNINILGELISTLPTYDTNSAAAAAGIPLWGFYRTGGILKIMTDVIAPIITLNGSSSISVSQGLAYTELGATAIDYFNNSIIPIISGSVNTSTIGLYTITYTATDSYGNISVVTRIVNVIINTSVPIITLNGSSLFKLAMGSTFIDPGISISDTISDIININGTVNSNIPGKYELSYSVTNIAGNTSNIVTRTVYILNTTTQLYYNLTFNYLINTYNYTSIITNNYWTAEGWIYLNSYTTNSNFISFNNILNLIINSSGYLGITLSGITNVISTNPISLSTWTHIVYLRRGIFLEIYINGTYISNLSINTNNLSNLTNLILGNNNFNGYISQARLTSDTKYNNCYIIPNNISSTDTNIIFYLGNNNNDLITNNNLSYNTLPATGNRTYFLTLPVTNITPEYLLFNFQISNLILSNQTTNNLTWTDSTNNYILQLLSSANQTNIKYVQNCNGLGIYNNTGFTFTSASNTTFLSNNWSQGLTLEQWIYIDYDFIPSITNTIICGQYGIYGFSFAPANYSTYNGSILTFNGGTILSTGNLINLNAMRGKWNHICLSISTVLMNSKQLNLYLNGGLALSLTTNTSINPATGNNFSLFSNNSGTIDSNTFGKVYYGNCRLYNRILVQDEIINNYYYELPSYTLSTFNNIYTSPISWTMTPTSSTIYTNYKLQRINFTNNNYVYYNYSVLANTNYTFSLNVKLENATNFCIVATSGMTWGSISGQEYNFINSGLNNNTFKNIQFNFETKSLTNINIFIGTHNQPYLTVQSQGIVDIFNVNLTINSISPINSLSLLEPISLPITWSYYNGILPITTNGKIQTITFNSSSSIFQYNQLSIGLNYIFSCWIQLGTATNLILTITDISNNILLVQEFDIINSGLNTTSYTYITYTFQAKSNVNIYFGAFSNTRQTSGTIILSNFQINQTIINNPDIFYNPNSDINFMQSPNTIALATSTNYDTTSSGYLQQSVDLNELRIMPSWTIETWAFATSWGASNDAGWIIDFSTGSNYLAFGITSDNSKISPAITYDGLGRPFIYYSGDSINQWKINSSLTVPLNTWNHIVWQKDNETTLEMFINGISTGTFTVNTTDWKFPNFLSQNAINSIIIGGAKSNPTATTNHWKGKLSQSKITIGPKYTGPFTPTFDLSLGTNGLFLLQNNYTNNAIGKSMTNNSVIIPSYSPISLSLSGSSNIILYVGNTYTELGATISYYTRSNLNYSIIGNVNTSISGTYILSYNIIDAFYNSSYVNRLITVNSLPTINISFSNNTKTINLLFNGLYYSQSYSISGAQTISNTNFTGNSINVSTLPIGAYTITITLNDSSGTLIVSSSLNFIIITVLYLNNSSNIYIAPNGTYVEYGLSVSNYNGETLTPKVTSILYNGNQLITYPIAINQVASYINAINIGDIYIITYTVVDSMGNISNSNRTISISLCVSLKITTNNSLLYSNLKATSSTQWTLSFWLYCPNSSLGGSLFGPYDGSGYLYNFYGTLRNFSYETSGVMQLLYTPMPPNNTWTHIVINYNSTLSNANNRFICYYNNIQQPNSNAGNLPLNYVLQGFSSNNAFYIGNRQNYNSPLTGSLAQYYFIDGLAIPPTSFGTLSNGVWKAIPYNGSYGSGPNGFYLNFSNGNNIGQDSSGNNNNFTNVNIPSSNIDLVNIIPQ